MRNRNPAIVQIVSEEPPSFRCKKCGERWTPSVDADGRLPRGSWQCPNGCKPEIAELPEGTRALLEGFIRDLADIQANPSLSDRIDDKMTVIKCRLAIQEIEGKFGEMASKGIVNSGSQADAQELAAIEKENSPLERLRRRVQYTSKLLKRIEDELKWIREKWGL